MILSNLPRYKKFAGLLLLFVCISLAGWAVFKQHKYWPTPHQDQLVQRLNADLVHSEFLGQSIDKVKVYKSKRYLELWHNGQVVQRYPIRLGFNPLGNKQTEGDGKTPEGIYTLDWRNPNSQFYRALHVSYPNAHDQQRAAANGVRAGSNIMIHGSFPVRGKFTSSGKPFYHYLPQQDWTLGCIAVSNAAMDDIWTRVKNGTMIEIVP